MVVGYNFSCELGRTRGMVISPYVYSFSSKIWWCYSSQSGT